jgi:hypothetical protein
MKKSSLDILESKGVETVLKEMAQGQHGQEGSPVRGEVDAWIRSKQAVSEADSSAKRDAHEAETLAIAKEAKRWAMYATIIAAIAAIITIKDEILILIFGVS